jgi:hypothetical protein
MSTVADERSDPLPDWPRGWNAQTPDAEGWKSETASPKVGMSLSCERYPRSQFFEPVENHVDLRSREVSGRRSSHWHQTHELPVWGDVVERPGIGSARLERSRHRHSIPEGKRRLRHNADGLEAAEPRNVKKFLSVW